MINWLAATAGSAVDLDAMIIVPLAVTLRQDLTVSVTMISIATPGDP
jgi:hypothetical protein